MSRSIRDEDPAISLFDPEDSIEGLVEDDEDEISFEDDHPRDDEDTSVIDYSEDVEEE